ncbi:MAG: molybdopterin dehydrogenase [Spirochaetia bacterium]|nr:molybdopterin dehydrogenase [Spirochaetia bacterium]
MISEFIKGEGVQQALKEIQKGGLSAGFIAGGTEIQRLGTQKKYTKVVSLHSISLDTITSDTQKVVIGAMATFTQMAEDSQVPSYLKEAIKFCGSFTKRNMATIGGNIASLRDDSYLIPTLLAAKARVHIGDISVDGEYSVENIPLREYIEFREHFMGSLILAIELNRPKRIVFSQRFARTVQSPAAITVSFGAGIEEGTLTDVRIFAAIKGTGIIRLKKVEEGIAERQFLTPEDVATVVNSEIAFVDDITGSASYKHYILGSSVAHLYKRCLELTQEEA